LWINRPSSNYQGLFGYANGNVTFSNLTLLDVKVTGYESNGGLLGRIESLGSLEISGVSVGGDITATGSYDAGSIVGMSNTSTSISDSNSSATVNGNTYVGGLVGCAYNSSNLTVTNSYSTGNVSGATEVGGLVGGALKPMTVTNSYATGDISGSSIYTGGLVGKAHSSLTVTNSYATGNINGAYIVGGIIGYAASSLQVTNSYSTGNVSGNSTEVGGLIGAEHSSLTVTNSYSTGKISGVNDVGGILGFLSSGGAATINNSVSLSQLITASDTTYTPTPYVRRIAGCISSGATLTLANNYGLSRTLVGLTDSEAEVTSEDSASVEGKTAYTTQINKASFWKETVGLDDTIWTIEDGKLPVLKGFSAESQAESASFEGKNWMHPFSGVNIDGYASSNLLFTGSLSKYATTTSLEVYPAYLCGVNPVSCDGIKQEVEYSISQSSASPGTNWQDSTTFTGLNPDSEYYVSARSKAFGDYLSGDIMTSSAFRTLSANQIAYRDQSDADHGDFPWWTFDDGSGTLTIRLENYYATTHDDSAQIIGDHCVFAQALSAAGPEDLCINHFEHVRFTNANGAVKTLTIKYMAFTQYLMFTLQDVEFPTGLTSITLEPQAIAQFSEPRATGTPEPTTLKYVFVPLTSSENITISPLSVVHTACPHSQLPEVSALDGDPSGEDPEDEPCTFDTTIPVYYLGENANQTGDLDTGSHTLTNLPLTNVRSDLKTTTGTILNQSSDFTVTSGQNVTVINASATFGGRTNQPTFVQALDFSSGETSQFGEYKLTSSNASDQISASGITFGIAGSRTVTLSTTNPYANPAQTVQTTYNVTVHESIPPDPTPPETPEELIINPSEIQGAWVDANGVVHANQNGTITILLHEKLHDGKTVEAKLEDYDLSSSVDTDIIKDNTVTFPHASPHIITASLKSNSALTTQVLVEVEPVSTPVDPTTPNTPDNPNNPANPSASNTSTIGSVAQTGVPANVLGLVMLMMLLLGVGLGVRKRTV
jgi:hypothetical protein